MRVLHVGNFGRRRCGISNFAHQTSIALRRAGAIVHEWDGNYDTIYAALQRNEPAYLPADAEEYDVIHFTWHPVTINHYLAAHFPPGPLKSIYLTDVPPDSSCPCLDAFDVRMSALPHAILATPQCPDGLVVPYPIIDWVDQLPQPNAEFTVGSSSIRGDGVEMIAEICETHGWTFNRSDPDQWLSIDEEVRRLARSSVNVCWYAASRNLAGAPMTCLASRRPLLINRSPMFQHLFAYRPAVIVARRATRTQLVQHLERLSRRWTRGWDHQTPGVVLLEEVGDGPLTRSGRLCRLLRVTDSRWAHLWYTFGWTHAAERMLQTWKDAAS